MGRSFLRGEGEIKFRSKSRGEDLAPQINQLLYLVFHGIQKRDSVNFRLDERFVIFIGSIGELDGNSIS